MAVKYIWTPETDKKLVELRAAGHSIKVVSQKIGVGEIGVRDRLRFLGVKLSASQRCANNRRSLEGRGISAYRWGITHEESVARTSNDRFVALYTAVAKVQHWIVRDVRS